MKAVIGLDAGHGGSSSGTYSCNTVNDGLFERDFTLEMALLLEERLLRNGFGVIMSRRSDINPGNVSKRAQKMIDQKADFALSIHFNGFRNESANGTEVFVPYGEQFAPIEVGFFDTLEKYFKVRVPFARSNNFYDRNETFDKKINRKTKLFDATSDKKDYFGFIRTCWAAGVSADLLEICFLTNPSDFKAYIENKEAIADGLAKSIVEGFGETWKPAKKTGPAIDKVVLKNRIEMIK